MRGTGPGSVYKSPRGPVSKMKLKLSEVCHSSRHISRTETMPACFWPWSWPQPLPPQVCSPGCESRAKPSCLGSLEGISTSPHPSPRVGILGSAEVAAPPDTHRSIGHLTLQGHRLEGSRFPPTLLPAGPNPVANPINHLHSPIPQECDGLIKVSPGLNKPTNPGF